ncbi:DUF3732 domain-containing protein [Parasaccharibacter sp. TMW 2.1886]|nr:DUF3732 domain-containing protein [Parasaccharibacter sp. TMW 2.1886]
MRFYITGLHIWLKNGTRRDINFLPDKINVITGDSNTGKTAILSIIDYCLMSRNHQIPESIINENALYYGISFLLNSKEWSIIRESPTKEKVSNNFYLSTSGTIPKNPPSKKISREVLKKILNNEFCLGRKIMMPYGGEAVAQNSSISFRHFLIFNKISQNIITHSREFFDNQDSPHHKEVLHRIFDISVNIDTYNNTIKKEKYDTLERELKKNIKKKDILEKHKQAFSSELKFYIQELRRHDFLQEEIFPVDEIENIISQMIENDPTTFPDEPEKISSQIYNISREIKALENFQKSYRNYKNTLKRTEDSLEPIKYICEHYNEIIKTSKFSEIIEKLSNDLENIKKITADKTPLTGNIAQKLHDLRIQKKELKEKISSSPQTQSTLETLKERYVFLGEMKAKLEIFSKNDEGDLGKISKKIKEIENKIEKIKYEPNEVNRDNFISFLNEIINNYINETSEAIENYKNYKSSFNYKEKKLYLRKSNNMSPENIGSTSNHLFLHLYLFLGLHEAILHNKGQYVAPFLIIDQLSRPFWEGNKKGPISHQNTKKSDITKVRIALKLLNIFMEKVHRMNKHFQIILFEHIEPELWKNLKNFHLVEEFKGGNALIPEHEKN